MKAKQGRASLTYLSSYAAKAKDIFHLALRQKMSNDVSFSSQPCEESLAPWRCLKSDILDLGPTENICFSICYMMFCSRGMTRSFFVCLSLDLWFLLVRWSPWLPRVNGRHVSLSQSKTAQKQTGAKRNFSVCFFLLSRTKWIIMSESLLLTSIDCETSCLFLLNTSMKAGRSFVLFNMGHTTVH